MNPLIIVGLVIVFFLFLFLRTKGGSSFEITEEFSEILRLLNNSRKSIFITGKAGTGKSSLLNHFIKNTRKRFVILAPTGIAALNVGGQTVHSFFKFPPSVINSDRLKVDYVRSNLFQNLDMVIIDEVSMVRSDLMNGIDVSLRLNRNKLSEPFGGVQIVLIGDLFQLPPVVTNSDRDYIFNTYGGEYFFNAPVFKEFSYEFKELTRIFRQSEEQNKFKNLLNNIRENKIQFEDLALLNSRHRDNVKLVSDSVFLTSLRNIARAINTNELDKIKSRQIEYKATLGGKYLKLIENEDESLEDRFPAPYKLILKQGAQIMMLKNDPGRRWANGTVGLIDELTESGVWVKLPSGRHKIERENWNEVEYPYNQESAKIEKKTAAEFQQYPLQLSFAMTIHKSQGKTFNRIVVDIGSGAFAHGQVYVALSRCTSLEGIVLNNPISQKDIIVDPAIVEFYGKRKIPSNFARASRPTKEIVSTLITDVILKAISEKRNVIIEYENYHGHKSKRELSSISISNDYAKKGYSNEHIKGFCHKKKEERQFKIERITKIEIV